MTRKPAPRRQRDRSEHRCERLITLPSEEFAPGSLINELRTKVGEQLAFCRRLLESPSVTTQIPEIEPNWEACAQSIASAPRKETFVERGFTYYREHGAEPDAWGRQDARRPKAEHGTVGAAAVLSSRKRGDIVFISRNW